MDFEQNLTISLFKTGKLKHGMHVYVPQKVALICIPKYVDENTFIAHFENYCLSNQISEFSIISEGISTEEKNGLIENNKVLFCLKLQPNNNILFSIPIRGNEVVGTWYKEVNGIASEEWAACLFRSYRLN